MNQELKMHSKMNHKLPFTLATLSPYSIHHLQAACIDNTRNCTLEAGNKARAVSVKKCDDEAKFTHFSELPLEIQAKIWKIFIETQPRIVQLGSFKNEPNVLRQLNRQIKEDCLTLHGFVDVDHSRKQERNNNTVFHPETDLIHLGPNSLGIWGPRSSVRRFAACGALDKIRCVAIVKPTTDLATEIQFERLREYKNLELVFVIVHVTIQDSIVGWKDTEWVRFQAVEEQEGAGSVDNRGSNFPWCRMPQQYQEKIQALMARGPHRVAPRVVFVEEIRSWKELIGKE